MEDKDNGFGYYGNDDIDKTTAYIDGKSNAENDRPYATSEVVRSAKDRNPISTFAYLGIDLSLLGVLVVPFLVVHHPVCIIIGLALFWIRLIYLAIFHNNVNVNHFVRYRILTSILLAVLMVISTIVGISFGANFMNISSLDSILNDMLRMLESL